MRALSVVLLLSSAIVACQYAELPKLGGDGSVTVDAPGGCTGTTLACGTDNALYQCNKDSGQLTKVQDCRYGCANDRCKECQANTTFCSGNDLVMCDSSGTIVNPSTCANGCQAERCNTCMPGASYCDGSGNAVTCGLDGTPGTPNTCGANGCVNGVCNSCTPNTVTCRGDTLVTCGGNGMVQATTACTFGCGTSPSSHCKVFTPSYGLSVPTGALPDLVVDNDTRLDIGGCANGTAQLSVVANGNATTTTLMSPQVSTVAQTNGPPICVVRFAKVTVKAGFTLKVINLSYYSATANDHLLSLQATDDVTIAGTLEFNGLYGGPARGASIVAQKTTHYYIAPGAGGGGGARAGGTGGACTGCPIATPGGVGGAAITNVRVVLNRGSQGGAIGTPDGFMVDIGSGAYGGGAIHLLSMTRVIVASTGKLDLNGHGGYGRTFGYHDLGQGGGSGGTLVIEAPFVSFSASALAVANGGGAAGGCAVCDGNGSCTYADGQSGQLSAARATGGNCNGAGNGGWEANSELVPSANGSNANGSADISGGGGGGSNGFIFLRGKTGANVMVTTGAVISPAPTIEAVTAN